MPTSLPRWRPVAALVILIGASFLATPPGVRAYQGMSSRFVSSRTALLLAAAALYRLVMDVRDLRRMAAR